MRSICVTVPAEVVKLSDIIKAKEYLSEKLFCEQAASYHSGNIVWITFPQQCVDPSPEFMKEVIVPGVLEFFPHESILNFELSDEKEETLQYLAKMYGYL